MTPDYSFGSRVGPSVGQKSSRANMQLLVLSQCPSWFCNNINNKYIVIKKCILKLHAVLSLIVKICESQEYFGDVLSVLLVTNHSVIHIFTAEPDNLRNYDIRDPRSVTDCWQPWTMTPTLHDTLTI